MAASGMAGMPTSCNDPFSAAITERRDPIVRDLPPLHARSLVERSGSTRQLFRRSVCRKSHGPFASSHASHRREVRPIEDRATARHCLHIQPLDARQLPIYRVHPDRTDSRSVHVAEHRAVASHNPAADRSTTRRRRRWAPTAGPCFSRGPHPRSTPRIQSLGASGMPKA